MYSLEQAPRKQTSQAGPKEPGRQECAEEELVAVKKDGELPENHELRQHRKKAII